ncbi:hypothetical protein [Stutzerimonas nitrititolerans]|uniref:hypothetical protein n=1 Tax=Stutzerimonas nitrititolerans TaxID=2482751 RepID=UPI0028AD0A73|nr:hypothetical protein [Stutzerimonas nitrititolerans]
MKVRQFGQSMTEYLVVLGVTGGVLLATTTDVTTLFDNVDRSYRTQSSEMNKVQLYNSQKVRFNENGGQDEDFDDGDTPPPDDTALPDPTLPHIEMVYDAQGNLLGTLEDGYLVDERGERVALCKRSANGECVFVDEDGNIIFPGATTNPKWVDDDGNELPLMALTSGGKVYGFAYLYRNKLYSAADRKLLDPQPGGFTARPMRRVMELNASGVPQLTGYELDGRLYSLKATTQLKPTFDKALAPEKEELVNVRFTTPPTTKWQGYKPCLVMPKDWKANLTDNAPLPGFWKDKFDDPSLRLGVGSGELRGAGGFIDAAAADCGGASTVTHDPVSGQWMLTK